MKILKLIFEGLDFFDNSKVEIDFTAEDKVTEPNTTYHLFKNTYTQNTLAFIGINATGKTTLLRLCEMAMQIIIESKDLNELEYKELIKDRLTITAYLWIEEEIVEWKARIISKREQGGGFFYLDKKILSYEEEEIKTKKTGLIRRKSDIFAFDGIESRKIRSHIIASKVNLYLKDSTSILLEYKDKMGLSVLSLIGLTNVNFWVNGGKELLPEILKVLDSNLDYIDSEMNDEDVKYRIKFKGKEEIIQLQGFLQLERFVSAGTIKGAAVFKGMLLALVTGGYLLIDELENHLNKEIIRLIYDIFNSKRTNPNGATLIFSTHYVEILDFLSRKDNIYITRKKGNKSETVRFSHQRKRNDVKKSEIILKNLIQGTAPNFSAVNDLKDFVEIIVSKTSEHWKGGVSEKI